MSNPIPTPTGFDPDASLQTVWAALERLEAFTQIAAQLDNQDGLYDDILKIVEENRLTDDERDDVNTAMAWLQETVENDPR